MEENKIESVQVFGRKKTATAVAYCKKGRGLIKVNGKPVNLLEPQILQTKVYEAVLLLGAERFSNVGTFCWTLSCLDHVIIHCTKQSNNWLFNQLDFLFAFRCSL
mmetsp:Transcript_2496/g.3950  ORF Transcript_2496/g.3950 Transcript_2496/m.3950 type:complete len:105 (-) Transcript_2496:771-1085(-)